MEKLALLKSVFVFSGLEIDLLLNIAKQLKELKLAAGSEIFREGSHSDSFYIIESGEIIISKCLGVDRRKTLAILGTGSVFGEMAFFGDLPRTADASAKTDSLIWKIDKDDFSNIILEQPHAGLQVLSGLLQVTLERLEQSSRELATIYQTGNAISTGNNLFNIARDIKDEILLAVTCADDVAIFIYNDFNMEYEPIAAPPDTRAIQPSHPMIGLIKENNSVS